MQKLLSLGLAIAAAIVLQSTSIAAVNLVSNGSFETNGGAGELAGGVTSLGSWTIGPAIVTGNTPAGSAVFDFLMNGQADSQGFATVFSPPNAFLWGPNTPVSAGGPVANGFTGSPDGGMFIGVDGGYATGLISQTISGLTVGQNYTLSFEWGAAQFSQYSGATNQDWKVTFGSTVVTTSTFSLASHGFSGWMNYSNTFTAASTSQTLSFLAQGTPVGIQPTTLLDGVSLTAATPAAAVPEAGSAFSLMIAGVAGIFGFRRFTRGV